MPGPRRVSIDRHGAAPLALALAVAALAGSCAGAPGSAAREPSETARLVLDCDVEDAEVWIDGHYIGAIARLRGGIDLAPGPRRIEVRHERYHTFYTRIALEPHERRDVNVHLARELR